MKGGLFQKAHLYTPGEFRRVAPFQEVLGAVLLPRLTPPRLIGPLERLERAILRRYPSLGYLGAYLFGYFHVRK